MKYLGLFFGLLVLGLIVFAGSAQNMPSNTKSLIELGWDSPTPNIVRANIKTMEQRPFDGLTVSLNAGRTIFNKTAYAESAFTQDRTDLEATKFTRLSQNFISIWSAREAGWDWFDDSDWIATITNARNFAKTAKAGNFKGFVFDPEPYGTNPWSYNAQLYPNQSFASVQAKVRQRGADFLSTIQKELPSVKILMLFGASLVKAQAEERGSLEKAAWVLLASFIDGMLDVINPQAQLIDGNENSYYYTNAQDFKDFQAFKQAARDYVSVENRVKYDQQVKIAHAIFADGLLNLLKSPRFFGYYLQNDRQRQQFLEYLSFHGLQNSDQYIWVYNEDMDWWNTRGKGVQLPSGLEETLKRVSQKVKRNQALGFNADFATLAVLGYNSKIQLTGNITLAGQGLGGVLLDAGFVLKGVDMACQRSQPDGYFSCTIPTGWTGTLKPSLQGYTFKPAVIEFKNLIQQADNQNFEAIKK